MSEKFEAKNIRETCALLETDPDRGLSEKEAAKRYEANGPNELKEAKKKSALESFLEQLNDPLIYVLMAAAVISLLLHEISDAAIIAVVVCMNAVVGMIQEGKAQRALDSLKKLTSPRAYCIRDGKEKEIAASQLVPGDVVCLEAGCQIPADLRLTRTSGLKVEESALTGESVPIENDCQRKPERMHGGLPPSPYLPVLPFHPECRASSALPPLYKGFLFPSWKNIHSALFRTKALPHL